MKNNKVRIYLTRHSETTSNFAKVLHGITDSDVSKNGIQQLMRLSEKFKDIPLDAVYSSPLIRTRKTAAAVNAHHRLPLQLNKDLIEINFGIYENMSYLDFEATGKDSVLWSDLIWQWECESGESMRDVYARVSLAILDIVEMEHFFSGGEIRHVAIVSHGMCIRNFLCFAYGLDFERLNEINWVDNASVSIIDFTYNGDAFDIAVVKENDHSHLLESERTKY